MSLNERLIGAGAVACTADTTDVFGDGSGIALYTMDYDASDESGSYDGIPTNVEFGVEGQINYGAGFNGSSSEITVNSFASLSQLGLSMWVNMPDITSSYALAARYGTNREFAIYNYQASNGFIASIYYNGNNGNAIIITAGDYLTNNTWHHIAFTSDGSTAPKLYIDGVERGTAQFSDAARCAYYTSSEPLAIGHFTTNSAYNLEGKIDQVRIFNKALNQTEVDTLYAETACVYTCTTDTVDYPTTNVAYYKLDNSAEDETGTYDGTATNINYTFGRFGQAAVFNGSSSYINTNYTKSGTTFSFSCWVNLNDTSSRQYIFGDFNSGGADASCSALLEVTAGDDLNLGIGNGSTISSITLIDGMVGYYGVWTHLGITINGTSGIIYINGTPVKTGTFSFSMANGQNPIALGMYSPFTGAGELNGLMDQVRIFSSALTSTQVTELYEEYECEDTSTFKTVLYTGNGSTQYISNVGFEPDFVWIKNRSSSDQNHALFDSVRGVQRELRSDSTAVEQNRNGTIYSLKSFNDNGFTVGDNTAGNYNVNGAVGGLYSGNAEFVAWCWKGGSDAVSNTDGTITSQVSANTAAGFSIVKFNGYQSSGTTVGHGLNSTPELIIAKNLDQTTSWPVWFDDAITMTSTTFTLENSTKYLALNSTTGYISYTLDRQFGGTLSGSPGDEMITYCFHSVSGYSKIGSYAGNSSTQTIVTGFEPSFVMIKTINTVSNWVIFDNKRPNEYLMPSLSSAGSSSTDMVTGFVSNGFTLGADASTAAVNSSAANYLYMAFK